MRDANGKRSLEVIAAFEFAKGLAALAVLLGIADLLHHDARHLVLELIGHAGTRPFAHMPTLLMHYADLLPTANWRAIFALGISYALLRFIEAYGLWRQRSWALLLGAASGGLYIPFEIFHVVRHPHAIGLGILAINCWLVAYLVFRLRVRFASSAENSGR